MKPLDKRFGHSKFSIMDDQQRGYILVCEYRIRLRGVDAPEKAPKGEPHKGQPYGDEARDHLASIIGDQSLKVIIYNVDDYGRCVADVYHGKDLVQHKLLEVGAVWRHPAYDNSIKFKELIARTQS